MNAVVDELFLRHSSWRQALQAAAGTCREVLCLVTEKWLASNDCLAEFDASFYMGKSFRSAAAMERYAGHERAQAGAGIIMRLDFCVACGVMTTASML